VGSCRARSGGRRRSASPRAALGDRDLHIGDHVDEYPIEVAAGQPGEGPFIAIGAIMYVLAGTCSPPALLSGCWRAKKSRRLGYKLIQRFARL